MTPIKKGTARRLGLQLPTASAYSLRTLTWPATGRPITHVIWPLGSPVSEEIYGWALVDGRLDSIETGP